jgi:hypothetical protein
MAGAGLRGVRYIIPLLQPGFPRRALLSKIKPSGSFFMHIFKAGEVM